MLAGNVASVGLTGNAISSLPTSLFPVMGKTKERLHGSELQESVVHRGGIKRVLIGNQVYN